MSKPRPYKIHFSGKRSSSCSSLSAAKYAIEMYLLQRDRIEKPYLSFPVEVWRWVDGRCKMVAKYHADGKFEVLEGKSDALHKEGTSYE